PREAETGRRVALRRAASAKVAVPAWWIVRPSATPLLAQEPLIVGRLTVGDDAECRRRVQTSVATSSPDREPHHSGDRPQMVIYVRRLETRLLGDALHAQEGTRN